MNYLELRNLIANYAHRKDLADQIKTAVALTENRIYRLVRAPENEFWKTVTVTESPFALPAEWVKGREVTKGGVNGRSQALEFMPPSQFWRMSGINANCPGFYTINQRAMSLEPVPSVDAPTTLQLGYWGRLNPLTNDSDENAMLASYPGLFIYGAMLELAPYTQDGEAYDAWKLAFNEHVREVNRQADDIRKGVNLAMRAS